MAQFGIGERIDTLVNKKVKELIVVDKDKITEEKPKNEDGTSRKLQNLKVNYTYNLQIGLDQLYERRLYENA